MKTLILLATVLLTGCASNCTSHCVAGFGPGNSVFDAIASHYDTKDPCQIAGKPQGYQYPGFCGAAKGRVVVRKINDTTYTVTQNK